MHGGRQRFILVADDEKAYRTIIARGLAGHGYQVLQAEDGQQALEMAKAQLPDLILLDVKMPRLDGLDVCRRLKADASMPFIPVILVTGESTTENIIAGLDAGADEYLTKPVDQAALVARVRSALRLKVLYEQVQRQSDELAVWNQTLELRVSTQVAELERMAQLKRFLSPPIAEMVISSGDESALESHRRDVAVVFCDLRGFTAFSEVAEPEEIMAMLRDYHARLGPLIHQAEGTLERFLGDGLLVLFNDPLPCSEPALRAVRMALAMRDEMAALTGIWARRGYDLGFGVGIAQGYATLGRIGFEGRTDYTDIGAVPNLAARLCGAAGNGQILDDGRVRIAVEGCVEVEAIDQVQLKGFHRSVPVFNVRGFQLQDGGAPVNDLGTTLGCVVGLA
jgi:DNA-binding response OmpR family regulator